MSLRFPRRPTRRGERRGDRRRLHLPLPRLGLFLAIPALITFICLLMVNGMVNGQIENDAFPHAHEGSDTSTHVPATISEGGPVMDASSRTPHSVHIPANTIVLTFDDGPDPRWTPAVLEVLRRHNVPATFFVVGSEAARYPWLLHDIRAAGSEVGLHTFTHPDLSTSSRMRVDRELTETQLVVNGATGETSYLIRPPFSSTAGSGSWSRRSPR